MPGIVFANFSLSCIFLNGSQLQSVRQMTWRLKCNQLPFSWPTCSFIDLPPPLQPEGFWLLLTMWHHHLQALLQRLWLSSLWPWVGQQDLFQFHEVRQMLLMSCNKISNKNHECSFVPRTAWALYGWGLDHQFPWWQTSWPQNWVEIEEVKLWNWPPFQVSPYISLCNSGYPWS